MLSTRATKQTEDIEVTRYLPSLRRFICKSCDEQWLAKTVNRLSNKKPQNDFDPLCLLPLTQRNQLLICKTSIGFLHHDIHGSTRALWSSAYCGEAVQTHMASHTCHLSGKMCFSDTISLVQLRHGQSNGNTSVHQTWTRFTLYPRHSFDITLNIYYSVPGRHNFQSGSIC